MAEVPELYDFAMDSYSEEEFYADGSSEMKDTIDPLGWEGYTSSHWEIQKPRKVVLSFKEAIKLIVIIGKVTRRNGFEQAYIFDDQDLLDPMEEDICMEEASNSFMATPKFNTYAFSICDSRGKYMMLRKSTEDCELVASFLQGRDTKKTEINMDVFRFLPFNKEDKRTVALSIKDTENHNYYLSLRGEKGTQGPPVLSLMKDINILEKKDNDLLPFLFYKSGNSLSNNTFESVAFQGWFICTSQIEEQPVQIKDRSDQQHIRNFQLYNVKSE